MDEKKQHKTTNNNQSKEISSVLLLPMAIVFLAICVSASLIISSSILSKTIKENGLGVNNANNSSNDTITTTPTLRADNPGEFNVGTDIPAGTIQALGNPNAKVKLIEFSDFQCPFCKLFNKDNDTFNQIKKDYIDTGKVQYIFRNYALSFHPKAKAAGVAGYCANDQGKFWEYKAKLYTEDITISNLGDFSAKATSENFIKWAKDIGMDEAKFKECIDSGKYNETINQDQNVFDNVAVKFKDLVTQKTDIDPKYRSLGTPTFVINGRVINGAYPLTNFKQVIDEELNK